MSISSEKFASEVCKGDRIVIDDKVYIVHDACRSKGFYRNGKILIIASHQQADDKVERIFNKSDLLLYEACHESYET